MRPRHVPGDVTYSEPAEGRHLTAAGVHWAHALPRLHTTAPARRLRRQHSAQSGAARSRTRRARATQAPSASTAPVMRADALCPCEAVSLADARPPAEPVHLEGHGPSSGSRWASGVPCQQADGGLPRRPRGPPAGLADDAEVADDETCGPDRESSARQPVSPPHRRTSLHSSSLHLWAGDSNPVRVPAVATTRPGPAAVHAPARTSSVFRTSAARKGPDMREAVPSPCPRLPKERVQQGQERLPTKDVRRRPTLPRSPPRSTIGANGLSFRVRNGTGRFPDAMTAETLRNERAPAPTTPQEGCVGHGSP